MMVETELKNIAWFHIELLHTLKSQAKKVYINESLCPPMQYLCFLARKAHKEKKISNYNLWRGRLSIQIEEDGDKIPIEHIQDLIDRGLAAEDSRSKFLMWYGTNIRDIMLLLLPSGYLLWTSISSMVRYILLLFTLLGHFNNMVSLLSSC